MQIPLSPAAKAVLQRLQEGGYQAYAVGGCVRDALIGRPIHDFDLCTNALPHQIEQCFEGWKTVPTGIAHGTVTVIYNGEAVEVTTYRLDGMYINHRRPEQVRFVPTLEQDLQRRDFTVNAMAWNAEQGLQDPFGGQQDLKDKVLRCVGDPAQRFQEDALRILRGMRFAARYGLTPEPVTAEAMHRLAPLLRHVSAERIRQELCGLLAAPDPLLILTAFSDIVTLILPELSDCIGFSQNSPYHCYDVYEHCIRATCAVPCDTTVRLALLLHDCGKPLCYSEKDGIGHFYGHTAYSEHRALQALTRLKADRACIESVLLLIHWHDVAIPATKVGIRRMLSRIGEPSLRQLLQVKRGDTLTHHPDYRQCRLSEIDSIEEILEEILQEPPCFSLRDLAVNGSDLQTIGISSGPVMGKILQQLLDAVVEEKLCNERQALLLAAEKMLTHPPF